MTEITSHPYFDKSGYLENQSIPNNLSVHFNDRLKNQFCCAINILMKTGLKKKKSILNNTLGKIIFF